MQASTLISLRANAVLIALCVAASDAAWLAICGCSGHPHALESPMVRIAILSSAAFVLIAVRRLAKLAFDAARATRRIARLLGTARYRATLLARLARAASCRIASGAIALQRRAVVRARRRVMQSATRSGVTSDFARSLLTRPRAGSFSWWRRLR
ncbi:hypothetical protein [Candidatus Burkholderia verschuerenii]|uniref:hypothetical protein n=1 Tax=Candidatus Burkholderia verschuerenii TaxID=242163 RepID=UPI000B010374|nr:hypothetical protein [Candidatus Burkholderia verschuerenii]